MSRASLINQNQLVRNVIWNLLGAAAPLVVALLAIPILVEGLGTARFGLLLLAWMVVGYFSLFDLGIGRALTKLVAEKLVEKSQANVPMLIQTGLILMALLGIVGAGIVAAISPWLVGHALKVPAELQSETLKAFYLLAASIPIVISTAGLRGILEAHQRFDLVNAVRIPLGIFTYVGPLLVLPFSSNLAVIVLALVVVRLVSWSCYAAACLRVVSATWQSSVFDTELMRQLIGFGSWMTVSNIVGPLMLYLDRFLIGALVSMSAVAFYATPYEMVTKLSIISAGLMGVMFPAFSTALALESQHAAQLYKRTITSIFIALFPLVLIFVTLSYQGLDWWLGAEFSRNSSLVLQLLLVGIFINSHADVPFGLLQSAGRPDLTAKLHLIELPFYLLALWWMVLNYGIVGAAITWSLRIAIDTILLFTVVHRVLPAISALNWKMVFTAFAALILIASGAMMTEFTNKLVFLAVIIIPFTMTVGLTLYTARKQQRRAN